MSNPEYRDRIKSTSRKLWSNPEHRKKMMSNMAAGSVTLKRLWADPEWHSRHAAKIKKSTSDPAYRARRKEIARKFMSDPVYSQLRGRISKGKWEDPTYRKKMMEIFADPAYRAKLSGENCYLYGKTPKHPKPIYYHGMTLRSSYELAFVKHLEARETKFAYEPERFKFDFGTYVPDFFIYNDDGSLAQIVEIKGWVKPIDIAKVSALREMMALRGVPVTMYTNRHLKEMGAL